MKNGQVRLGGSPQQVASGTTTGTRTARLTVELKLRLSPDDAARFRIRADDSGRTMSAYAVALLDGEGARGGPIDSPREALASVSRLASAIINLRSEFQATRADLGRCAGLLKSFFAESTAVAENHRAEINNAIFALRMAATGVDDARETAAAVLTPLQTECAIVAKRLARM